MPVRFQNLPELLNDMNRLGWIIDSFPFEYNEYSDRNNFKGYNWLLILLTTNSNSISPS